MKVLIHKKECDKTPSRLRYGNIISPHDANSYFESIMDEIGNLFKNEKCIMFGKPYVSERKTVQIADQNVELYKYNFVGSNEVYDWTVSKTIKK